MLNEKRKTEGEEFIFIPEHNLLQIQFGTSAKYKVPGLSFEDPLAHSSQITLKAVLSQIGLELGNLPLQCRDPQCERLRFRQSGGARTTKLEEESSFSRAIATKSAPQA